MAREVAVIGDNFMLPQMFEEKLRAACGDALEIRARKDAWPDAPMEHGYEVPGMEGLKEYMGDADEVVEFAAASEILVVHLAPMSRGMLERLPRLRMIAVSRGGPVNIDIEAARDRGVLVVNAPGRNASAVAEFAVGAILAETRKIRAGHEALRAGDWRGDLYRADATGRELGEMIVGVVGFGAVGTRVVQLLRPFGCRILVADPYVQLDPDDAAGGVEFASFDRTLKESDVLTLHARVTKETTGMMDAAAFARMKPGAVFVNTARGPLVDHDALHRALTVGPLGGAALDTFAAEPAPRDNPLLQLPNVTVTPHISGASVRTVARAAEQAAEEVRRYLVGEPPLNPC